MSINTPPVLSRNRTLVLFLFIVLVFSFLAYRSEVNANGLRHANRNTCRLATTEVRNVNAILDTIIIAVKTSSVLSVQEKHDRIQLYEGAKVAPIDCP